MLFENLLRRMLRRMLMIDEMPSDLVLVRHGESEGNLARNNQGWYNDPRFLARHSSQWRLTDKGRQQADAAGVWIRENILPNIPDHKFFRHYCSNYARARETAGHLKLQAEWLDSFYLRERDHGYMDICSKEERQNKFAEAVAHLKKDSFFNAPPNGESMATACIRVDKMNSTLSRECARKPVVLTCHGEIMWDERVLLERMPVEFFHELDKSLNEHDKIHNCQILWYTRRDPAIGKMEKYYGWVRSVCPWDLTKSSNDWKPIHRPRYTDSDLIQLAEAIPQIIR